MSDIRIRIGASLDVSVGAVFKEMAREVQRSRANTERELNKVVREEQKAADKRVKAEQKAEADKTKALAVESRKRDANRAKEAKAAEKEAKSFEKAAAKIEQDLTAVVEKEARRRDIIRRNSSIMAGKYAAQVAREEKAAADKAARDADVASRRADNERRRGLRRTGRSIRRGLNDVRHIVGGGMGMVGDLLSSLGVDLSLTSHMANAQELQQRITDVVNAGYVPGAKGAQGILQDQGEVHADVMGAANRGAFSGNEVAEGLQKFVGLTGDLDTGRQVLKEMATLARATGSDFVSMAEAAGEVANHLGPVKDKAGTVEEVMRTIAGQGKMGALEIKDFAKQMAKIAAQAPAFEGGVGKTIGDLALIAQYSKIGGGSASASQSATALVAFARDFSKKTTFKHWLTASMYNPKTHSTGGLNPFTDANHTTLRKPEELILEALRFSKGDTTKLAQLFPSSIAQRAVKPFANIYNEARGDEEDKIRAVSEAFTHMHNAAMTASEEARAFGAAMQTSKSKVQLANNRLDEMASKMHDTLVPALAALAPAVEALTPLVTDLFKGLAKYLGITESGDDDAKKLHDRKELLSGGEKELAGALATEPKLVAGEHGAEFVPGSVSQARINVEGKTVKDLGKEITEKRALYEKHAAQFAKEGYVDDFGTAGLIPGVSYHEGKPSDVRKREGGILQGELEKLNALEVERSRHTNLLERITAAVEQHRVIVIGTDGKQISDSAEPPEAQTY